jgi:hypothetical protein
MPSAEATVEVWTVNIKMIILLIYYSTFLVFNPFPLAKSNANVAKGCLSHGVGGHGRIRISV